MIQFHSTSNVGAPSRQFDAILRLAQERTAQGLAPPPEIYRIEFRQRVDWSQFPSWAHPTDPELFDNCCHEG